MQVRSCGRDGTLPVLFLAGEIDIETAPDIERHLRRSLGPFFHRHHLVIDLSQVSLIDSTFLRLVASLARRLHAERRELVLCGPVGPVRRVLALVGVPNVVPVYESLGDAVHALDGARLPLIPPRFAAAHQVGTVGPAA